MDRDCLIAHGMSSFIKESELNINGKATERLVNVCKSLNADTYISGIGGKGYLNEKLFEEKKIELRYQNCFMHALFIIN